MNPPVFVTAAELARMIDVSAVQAFNTEDDVRALAATARRHGFIAAHALPSLVPVLRAALPRGGGTLVGAPIGFPSGGHATTTKLAEARQLVADGGEELDMVLNVGRLRSGHDAYVGDEIRAVAEAIAPVRLKVILEVYHLNDDELRRACALAIRGGAAFVKTGTGWTPPGTTPARIRLITDFVGDAIGVKASGGVRSLQAVADMIGLGVTRFGINTEVAVRLVEACAALPQGRLAVPPRAAICARLDAAPPRED